MKDSDQVFADAIKEAIYALNDAVADAQKEGVLANLRLVNEDHKGQYIDFVKAKSIYKVFK